MLNLFLISLSLWQQGIIDESGFTGLKYPRFESGDCIRIEFSEGDYFYRQDYRIERIESPFYINSKLVATDDPLVFSYSPIIEIKEKIVFANQNAVLISCPIIE